jgi:hypothetical protein
LPGKVQGVKFFHPEGLAIDVDLSFPPKADESDFILLGIEGGGRSSARENNPAVPQKFKAGVGWIDQAFSAFDLVGLSKKPGMGHFRLLRSLLIFAD